MVNGKLGRRTISSTPEEDAGARWRIVQAFTVRVLLVVPGGQAKSDASEQMQRSVATREVTRGKLHPYDG